MARGVFPQKLKNKEGNRLRLLREAMGMTIREFAKEFEVSIGSISQWENGGRKIPGPMKKLMGIYENQLKSKERSQSTPL